MADQKLKNFKNIVKKAMNLKTDSEFKLFDMIPDEIHEDIFENNFNGNYQLARKIILNQFEQDDYKKIEKEKNKIHDMLKATKHISNSVVNGENVLFLTDTDNDGSLAQANIFAFEKALPEELSNRFHTLFCQEVNGNKTRGFTVDLIDLWLEKNPNLRNENFTIVTADNGINSREEQEKINDKYPNVTLIVTDHHNPDEENVVQPNKQTMVVNPKFKANKYFKEKNISGANVLGVLLENTLNDLSNTHNLTMDSKNKSIEHMREISRAANLLDYVDTDITDKPLKNHLVEKYSSLGALMNVNNSLNKIITSELSKEDIESLFSDVEGLDVKIISETIFKIRKENVLAKDLIALQKRFSALEEQDRLSLSKDRIYEDQIVALNKKSDSVVKDINPNYIEQLRPFIFNYTTSPDLLDYEQGIMEGMTSVYDRLKRLERTLQAEFGKCEVLNIDKQENTTIMYPKNTNHLSLLNRKLLGKIYNEENNGFLMILDTITPEKATGSFRSIYKIQDILENKNKIEEMFGIKISFQGHDKAAGFFIEKTDGAELRPEIITQVNNFINKNLSELKEKDKKNYTHLIQTDFNFDTIDIFNRYNKAVKGSLTNMQSLAPVVQFNKSTYLTNSKTLEDESLQQIVKSKKYGYVPANISFHGETVILPTELLRQIADSNFKDGIQVSFMNDGAFIGNKLIPNVNKQKLTKIKSKSSKREEMIEFYNEHYADKYFTKLPKEKLEKSPFFAANKFGESEFKRFESTVIRILDKSGKDMLVVADTEANGLGNAPKISNLGVVELSIDEDTGNTIRKSTFDKCAVKSDTGKRFLLTKTQLAGLRKISKSESDNLDFEIKHKVLRGINNSSDIYLAEALDDFKQLHNYAISGNSVVVNRELKADIGSVFIKDRDMKISEKIKTLTDIDNTLLNKIGISSKKADEIFSERYKGKKCIFQAHNLPYDLGVIKGNMNEFYKIMTDFEGGNLLNDSAIYSREQKLAYDPIDIAVFEKDVVPALHGIQFFHSEASDLSLINFLNTEEDGLLPDRTDRYILKKKQGKVTIIDTKENTEVKVEVARSEVLSKIPEKEDYGMDEISPENIDDFSTIELLKKHIIPVDMPKNAIKYSVQSLSDYDMIRAMILSSTDFKIKQVGIPAEFSNSKAKLDFFMLNYHFDASFNENFQNFTSTLDPEEYRDMFVTEGFIQEQLEKLEEEWTEEQKTAKRKKKKPDFRKMVPSDPKLTAFKSFVEEFLAENKDLQCKFHETWAYKKVLNAVNPTKENIKDKDLISMLAYSTSLSEEKIKTIMQEAIDYKKAYGLDNVIQKEPHNNIFFDECDVVMESILTFKRPTDRNYNTYNHSTENVVNMYLGNMLRTTYQHKRSQKRTMPIDSFSRKQALSYKRGNKTEYIQQSQEISPEIVKFKFKSTTLQQDQFAYGVLKKEITEAEVAELSEKLEFIVRHEQMKYSVDQKSYSGDYLDLKKSLDSIFEANELQVNQYKKELTEYFEEVYYSRKESNFKKCLELVQAAILNGQEIKVPRNMEPLMKREKNLLVQMTQEFSKLAVDLGMSKLDYFDIEELSLAKANKINDFSGKNDNSATATDHPLMSFLTKIPEITEEQLVEEYDKKLESLQNELGDDISGIEEALAKSAIIEKVTIKRKNDPKKIFEFNELLDNRLSELSEQEHSLSLNKKNKVGQKRKS